MKNTLRLSVLFSFLFLSNIGYTASTLAPDKCPGIKSIQTIGFDMARKENGSWWTAIQRSNKYDTNVAWTFYIGVEAENEDVALRKGAVALQSIYLFSGPLENDDHWGCLYFNNLKGYAIAITPVLNLDQISKYLEH